MCSTASISQPALPPLLLQTPRASRDQHPLVGLSPCCLKTTPCPTCRPPACWAEVHRCLPGLSPSGQAAPRWILQSLFHGFQSAWPPVPAVTTARRAGFLHSHPLLQDQPQTWQLGVGSPERNSPPLPRQPGTHPPPHLGIQTPTHLGLQTRLQAGWEGAQ